MITIIFRIQDIGHIGRHFFGNGSLFSWVMHWTTYWELNNIKIIPISFFFVKFQRHYYSSLLLQYEPHTGTKSLLSFPVCRSGRFQSLILFLMEHNPTKPKRHTLMASKLLGLSLKRDDSFIYNIVITMGTVFVRWGMRWLLEKHFFDGGNMRYILSVIIGIIMLFLLDGSLETLGWYKKVIEETKNTILWLHGNNTTIHPWKDHITKKR